MASNKCLCVFAGIYFVVFLTGVILFAKSFDVVELNNAALKQNTFSRNIESGVIYLPGRYRILLKIHLHRYFTGITGDFIRYNTTWYRIEYTQGGKITNFE